LAKIERICFHGLHATTAATNLRTALARRLPPSRPSR
jgi:hypothetical protein